MATTLMPELQTLLPMAAQAVAIAIAACVAALLLALGVTR